MKPGLLAAAFLLPAAAAAWGLMNAHEAPACRPAQRYAGSWSGRQTCSSGRYAVAFDLRGDTARYTVSPDGGEPVSGEVRLLAGPKPDTCAALAETPLGELGFSLRFAAGGARIFYQATGMQLMGTAVPAPGKVYGSANVDASAKRADYRFCSEVPLAADTCQGLLRRTSSR
ncbi:MAG: hypothetical protein NTY77_19115 [Elusimicrobia bacterium]|nr:hypothetical protein [Elusimicrobiota bacterium]